MQSLIDYRGYRVLAQPMLPLEGKIVYGSSDAGKHVVADPEFHGLMAEAAEQMHLAPHLVKGVELYSAGDVEGHRGKDGRLYVGLYLSLSVCLPYSD